MITAGSIAILRKGSGQLRRAARSVRDGQPVIGAASSGCREKVRQFLGRSCSSVGTGRACSRRPFQGLASCLGSRCSPHPSHGQVPARVTAKSGNSDRPASANAGRKLSACEIDARVRDRAAPGESAEQRNDATFQGGGSRYMELGSRTGDWEDHSGAYERYRVQGVPATRKPGGAAIRN